METTALTTENAADHIGAALTIMCCACGAVEYCAWRDGQGYKLGHEMDLISYCNEAGWQMRPDKEDPDVSEPICPKCGGVPKTYPYEGKDE